MSGSAGSVGAAVGEVSKGREAFVMPAILVALAVIVAIGITLASHFQGTPFPVCLWVGLGSSAPFFFVGLTQLTATKCAQKEG